MKLQRSILITPLIILSFFTYGQKPQAFLGVSAGASIPYGDFSSGDFENNGAGYAKTGFSLSTSYDHRITYNFGVSGLLIVHSNPWDEDDLIDGIEADSLDFADKLSVATSNWSSFGILVGPFLYVPLGEDFNFDIKATIGMYNIFAPEIVISGTQSNGENFSLRFLKYSGIGFAWNLGTTIRYKITNNRYIVLSGNYLSSTITFNDIERFNENGIITKESFDQNFTTLNITAGVGFAF
jgi:hypothetical protein